MQSDCKSRCVAPFRAARKHPLAAAMTSASVESEQLRSSPEPLIGPGRGWRSILIHPAQAPTLVSGQKLASVMTVALFGGRIKQAPVRSTRFKQGSGRRF